MNKSRDDLLRKIKALQAKATGNATEAEAISFLAKAHDLIRENNVQEYELNGGNIDGQEIDGTYCPVSIDLLHFRRMGQELARYYFGTMCWGKGERTGRRTAQAYYVFVGKPHNRLVMREMYIYLMKTIRRLAVEECQTKADRAEYAKGVAMRIAFEIFQRRKAREKPTGPITNRELLVIQDETAKAEEFATMFVDRTLPVARLNPELQKIGLDGWLKGKEVSIDEQIGSVNSDRKQIT